MQGPQGSNAAPEAGAPALLGGYRLLELLGRGGMGEVYRGEREGPGGYRRRAAIKRILPRFLNDPTLRARFLAEARINARLEHPNIVQVLEAGDQPEPFLVLEFVEGTTLAKVLKKCAETRQRIAPAAVAFLIAEAATGLDYAHRRTDDNGQPLQIIHRDVSPQNLLISVDGVVKVSDFGIARAADNQIRTAAGITVGKIAYMAPEQASGRAFDWRADVFALGVVLWETLLVRPLIPRNDSNAALQLLVSGRFEPPSRVDPALPPQLDAIVMGALAVDPNARTSSAGLLAQQLRTLCHAISPGFDGRELARSLSALMPEVPWQLSGGAAPDPGRPQSGMYQAPPAGAAPLAGMGAGAVLGGIGSQPLGAGAMGVAPGGALPMGGGMPGAGMPGGSLPMGGGMPGAGMPGGSLPMGGGMPGAGMPGGSLPMGGGMPPGGSLPMGGAAPLGNPAMGLPGLNPMGNPPPLAGPPPRPDGGSRPSPVVNTDSGDRPIAPPPPPKAREPMSTRTKTYLIAGAMVFVVLLVFLWITRWRLNDMAVGHGGPSIVVDGGGAAPVVRRLPPPDEHTTEVAAPPVRNYYPLACAAVDRLEPQVIACLGANRRVVETTVAQVAFSNATGNVSGTTINFTGERDRRRVPVLRQCITTALAGAHFATDAGAVGFTTCERTWSMSRRGRGGGGGVSDEIRFPFGHPE